MQTNRSKNPKTTAQTLQRVLVKAVGMFYASFTGLNVEAGHSLTVYRGGAVWFTITAQASDNEQGDTN